MNVTEISKDGLKHEFRVVVDKAEIERQVAVKLKDIAGRVKIPGFRPGKVPMPMLKQRYGTSVMGEVIEQTVTETSGRAVADKGLRPALQPKIEIKTIGDDATDLEYTLSVEVLPEIGEVTLTGIELERPVFKATDAEVDEALGKIAERYKSSEPVKSKRAAKAGDIVVIDFKGTVDGEARPGMDGTDFELELGSGSFIPGFEDQLTGAKPGESRTVNVTFPDDYGAAELQGKAAVFEVTVKDLKKPIPAKLDDELAKKLGMESLEAVKEAVTRQLQSDYDGYTKLKLKRALLDKFAESHSFDVPPSMVDMEFEAIWKRVEEDAKSGKDAQEPSATDMEKDKAEYRAIAVRRVRLGLLLNEIGRRQNLQVTQDELNRALMMEARNYPGQEKMIVEFYRKNPRAIENLRAPLYEDKVVTYVLGQVKLTDKPVSRDELIAMGDDDGDE